MNHDYSICTRAVKGGNFTNEPGKVRYLKSPRQDGGKPQPAHEIPVSTWVEEVRDIADGIADSRVTEGGDVLVFVHGYNNTQETIARRQRYLNEDLAAEGFKGLVIAFDWPCADATLNYLEDRWDAAQVADQLVTKGIQLIARGQQNGCETNIHLLGHSTGAYLIMEACAQAQKKGSLFKQDWRIGQVAFIGGDVSANALAADSAWGSSMFEHALRITNYSNPYDSVLAVSNAKRLGTAPRAGRVGTPKNNTHPKVANVDCGDYFKTLNPKRERFEGTFCHSWHIGNRVFARDLALTLTGGIDRNAIPTRLVRGDGTLSLQDQPAPEFFKDWSWNPGRKLNQQTNLNQPSLMHHGPVSPQIAKGLLALKKRITAAKIPPSKLDETINVAIWNIREFSKKPRTEAAIHYIAEILGQFDLIALVELRDALADLGKVLPILGESWDVVYSDWIDDAGGNDERTAFLYDRRAVTFNGLAAEVDAPRKKSATEWLANQSFWRAPYLCSFRAGNFDFLALATHTRWGDSLMGRQKELQMLADWIDVRMKSKSVEDKDLIVMGDFNIPKIKDSLFNALTSRGLQIPDVLVNLKVGNQVVGGTNLGKNARYDQILHHPTLKDRFSDKGGTLDFFLDDAHIKELFPTENYTREQFSFQMSDHFPVWVQIKTDIEGQRLNQIIQNARKGGG